MSARVAWIHVAPIKALAIQALDSVELGPRGVENDRRFCIVEQDGRMLNAKRVQRFVAIRPRFDADFRHLVLELPDGSAVEGPAGQGQATTVTIYGRTVPAHAVDGPWSEVLSAVAARPVRFVRFDDPGEGVDRADEAAGASLLSEESLRSIAKAAGVRARGDPRRLPMPFGLQG